MRRSTRTLLGALALTLAVTAVPLAGGPAGAEPGGTGDRARPTMTLESSEYTVETIVTALDDSPLQPATYFRRTDDVGSSGTEPDGHGAVQFSAWSGASGPNCLTSSGGEFTFPDAGPHTFTYGLAGSHIARVRIVESDGDVITARPQRRVGFGAFRAWLVERPGGAFDRIEGLDHRGRVVATIGAGGGPFVDDFGYSIETC
jgi:hypothetical protein